MNFGDVFNETVNKFSAKQVLEFEGMKLTYHELDLNVQRAAHILTSLGVKTGDRIAVQIPKCLEFLYIYLACMKTGAIILPLNTAYPEPELEYFLSDSESKVFFTCMNQREFASNLSQKLRSLQRVVYVDDLGSEGFKARMDKASCDHAAYPNGRSSSEDIAAILYTSGTTGKPKGAMITHGNLIANANSLNAAWGWSDRDILLHALPLFHVHGLFVAFNGVIRAGASMIMTAKFDAHEVLSMLQNKTCTIFMGVPTMYNRFVRLEHPEQYDLSGVRVFISGSAPLSVETFNEFKRRYGHEVLERYGMTEVGMAASNPLDGHRVAGSVGFPLPGVEIRVLAPDGLSDAKPLETGEVMIRGENVFRGYWRMPEKTRETIDSNGWLKSGDLGYRDKEGRLFLSGRAHELIITGGFNVYPREVEMVLEEHPCVAESAVIGIPDPDFGERIAGIVVPEPGKTPTASELIDHAQKSLAKYKCPKQIHFISELPRNAMGKIRKDILIKRYF